MNKLILSVFAVSLAAFGCSRSNSAPAATAPAAPAPAITENTSEFNLPNENSNRGVGGGPMSGTYGDDSFKSTPDTSGTWDQSGFGTGNGEKGIGGGPKDGAATDGVPANPGAKTKPKSGGTSPGTGSGTGVGAGSSSGGFGGTGGSGGMGGGQ